MAQMLEKSAKRPNDGSSKRPVNTHPPSTYERATYFSRLLCLYVFPFLYRHYNRPIDLNDIEVNARSHQCDLLGGQLRKHWKTEVTRQRTGKSASILRALFKTFGWTFLQMNFWNFIVYGLIKNVLPLILGKMIHYSNLYMEEMAAMSALDISNGTFAFSNNSIPDALPTVNRTLPGSWPLPLTNRTCVLLYSALLGALVLLNVIISHPYYMLKYRLGMRIRVALTRLIYEKALRLTNQTVQRNTVGRITNLVANDAARFDTVFIFAEFVYLSLLEAPVAMLFLYLYIGRSSLGALAITLLYLPFQTIMANILAKFRSASIGLTDDRLRLMAEILPAMRVIKMYVWEEPFKRLVHLARKLEIGKIRQSMMLRCLNMALFFVSSKVISFVCILLFLLDGGQLNAEIVFAALALINNIRYLMTFLFPQGVAYASDTYISVKRIEKFLLELELDEEHQPLASPEVSLERDSPKITLANVSVHLDGATILKKISFEASAGKLTTIIGPVGSGKSSVLLSILNELPVSSPGRVAVTGSVIYASQEAWIVAGTLRDNVLFGRPFQAERYREVVRAAALTKDFQLFEEGDQTVVEDRGTSLSGGQRARISLARALYTDADIYLLDDVISAVDATVAKHIFERCIKGYLQRKCVLLVTHQLQFVKQADQIVVLKDGGCLAAGSYRDLLNRGIDLFRYTARKPEAASPEGAVSPVASPLANRRRLESRTSRTSSFIEPATSDIESLYDDVSLLDYGAHASSQPTDAQEVTTSGRPKKRSILHTYYIYIRAGAGLLLFLTFLLSTIGCQFVFTGGDYFLSLWTAYEEQLVIQSENANYTVHRHPLVAPEIEGNILIYSIIVLVLFIFAILRTLSYFTICMRSSVNLHNRIFSSLIEAPIHFFDQTPVGILMNRLSRDLNIIDDVLPSTGFESLEVLGNSAGIFILCTALNYYIVVPLLAVLLGVAFAQKFYVNTARKLKRLEGSARSPLFSQLATSLTGLTTIRAYHSQDAFLDRFSATQDRHTATFFTFLSSSRFYGIVLEIVCVGYIYCLMIALNIQLDQYSGAIIGLTISQSLLLCNSFNWGVRQYTEVETYMTSVERIAEFGQLEREPLEACQQVPPEEWPHCGLIEYEAVSLAYEATVPEAGEAALVPVLRDLTFTIRGGEKAAIVGRTGAGKSSLITTLFRLTQPSGCIRIDGIDTSTISLSRLRQCLSIIPQEPILFSGTIRRNLDPFGSRSDAELWDAIEKVQLKEKIASFPAKLDSPVTDGGADFSVGQKQLVCLARAILRQNRILAIDEATSNVDERTDSLIQATIRTQFAHCTVLTIAHRLNTIIDYDRVLVLDGGRLVQFDSPLALIRAGKGVFYELWESLQADVKVELLAVAEKAEAEKSLRL